MTISGLIFFRAPGRFGNAANAIRRGHGAWRTNKRQRKLLLIDYGRTGCAAADNESRKKSENLARYLIHLMVQ